VEEEYETKRDKYVAERELKKLMRELEL